MFKVGDIVKFSEGPFSYITEEGTVVGIDQRSKTYPLVVRIPINEAAGQEGRYMQIPCSEAELDKI
jgi:transcription antitermination factor NusG